LPFSHSIGGGACVVVSGGTTVMTLPKNTVAAKMGCTMHAAIKSGEPCRPFCKEG